MVEENTPNLEAKLNEYSSVVHVERQKRRVNANHSVCEKACYLDEHIPTRYLQCSANFNATASLCSSDLVENEHFVSPIPIESKKMEDISQSYNKFAINLYRKLTTNGNNLFISPYSIVSALSMCYAGARHNTEKQMKEVLNYENLSNEQVHKLNLDLINHLKSLHGNVQLNVANKIYPKVGYEIKQEFVDLLKTYYNSDVQSLDYSNAKQSADVINNWVKEQTKNKIDNLINESAINNLVRLILVNAIYFKGNWLNKFESQKTTKEKFYLSNGSTKDIQMMTLLNKKFALEVNPSDLPAKICDLPYFGEQLSMKIILPNEGVALSDVESKLNADVLNNLLGMGNFKSKVHLYLPKFKFEESLELSSVLKTMGASDAFDEHRADFTGINEDPNGLYISKVIHKAVVEVSEEGTEAAAATGVIMMTSCAVMVDIPPEEFRCDRPFIFIIHDKTNRTILFIGKYESPN